jgi:hypothetical protein
MKLSPPITHRLSVALLFAAAFLLLRSSRANAQQVTIDFGGGHPQPVTNTITNGGFEVQGVPNRKFRYEVFN